MRQILHAAMADVFPHFSHVLTTILSNMHGNIDVLGDRVLAMNIDTCLSDIGCLTELDLSLGHSLSPFFNMTKTRLGTLLPIMGMLLFLSDAWKKSTCMYINQYDVFLNNEHCIQYALSSLITCCCGKETLQDLRNSHMLELPSESALDQMYDDTGSVLTSMTLPHMSAPMHRVSVGTKRAHSIAHGKNGESFSMPYQSVIRVVSVEECMDMRSSTSMIAQFDLKIHSKIYLKASAGLLLMLKSDESGYYDKVPINALLTLLEHFVTASPVLYSSDLEEVLPFGIIHSARRDICMGKVRPCDVSTKV